MTASGGLRPAPSGTTWPAEVMRRCTIQPGTTALRAPDGDVSYAALGASVLEAAWALKAAGVRSQEPVLVLAGRDVDSVVAILATMLVGAIAVPVAPDIPRERLATLAATAGSRTMLVASVDVPFVPGVDRRVSLPAGRRDPAPAADVPLLAGPEPEATAYVMHTSGSSGRPKAVAISHASLWEFVRSHQQDVFGPIQPAVQVALSNNPLWTDSGFAELTGLAAGRTLVLVDEVMRRNPEALLQMIAREHVEYLDATPTQVANLLSAGGEPVLRGLRLLVVGGEAVSPDLWGALAALPGPRILNMYGPTECTIDVAFADVRDSLTPTIGRAIGTNELHVVGSDGTVLPDGATGELWITGGQLAVGYHGDPAATESAFIEFRTSPQAPSRRAYRTGDRGHRRPDGRYVVEGRMDRQVKVRGFRVELAEVEAVLVGAPGVRAAHAMCLLDEHGRSTLHAAVVLTKPHGAESAAQHLRRLLPDHMVPRLHETARLPQAPSGKVDEGALRAVFAATAVPPATGDGLPTGSEFGGRTRVHELVVAAWMPFVDASAIDDDSGFFALGGDSLAAAQMTLDLRGTLAVNLPIGLVFTHDVLRDYVAAVERLTAGAAQGPDA